MSGQNVMLLAILAGVLLALLGVGPRARLVGIIVLIAIYVPLAGAGPSIQRAGVMGAAGIAAGLLGRPADRAYLPLLAAAVTLLLNPHAGAEIGWQLSFAAVVGIALWATRLRRLLAPRLRAARLPERLAEPLAEGAGLTLAATLATAPLLALHFGTVSLASLPANLVVLPAVAPVMWLGMLAGLLGQLPGLPLGWLAPAQGPLLDYVAGVAALFAAPSWATVDLTEPAPEAVLVIYLGLLCGLAAALAALDRRRGMGLARASRLRLALVAALIGAVGLTTAPGPGSTPVARGALRVSALNVGQGDAILLDGPGTPAVLVDAGPPGAELGRQLRGMGVSELAALFLTHDQRDHSGGLAELLSSVEVERLLLARPAPEPAALARAAGVPVDRVGEGAELAFGPLRIQALAPRAGADPAADPNADSLVLAARFAGWSALLTGDAEAEASGLDPGPFDLLKVAHHGSADAGLGRLLDRSAPRVALISVGADNRYGHPSPETLEELRERAVCVLRTDLDGRAWAELGPGGMAVGSERGGVEDRCRN